MFRNKQSIKNFFFFNFFFIFHVFDRIFSMPRKIPFTFILFTYITVSSYICTFLVYPADEDNEFSSSYYNMVSKSVRYDERSETYKKKIISNKMRIFRVYFIDVIPHQVHHLHINSNFFFEK